MTETQSHTVRNGVIVTVVGGLILAAILYAIPYARTLSLTFIAWVWSGVVWAWKAFTSSYSTPGWLILIIGLLAVYGVATIFVALRPKKEPSFKKYTEDVFYGAKWRWSWVGGRVSNLWCYCPRCDAQLVYNDTPIPYEERKTDFICERCNGQVVATIRGGGKTYAVGAAEREFLRRVRTNEYLSSISKQ